MVTGSNTVVIEPTRRPHPFPETSEGQLALVIWLVWSPFPGKPREFRPYASALLELLDTDGRTRADVAAALRGLREGPLGIRLDDEADLRAASSLLDWHEWFVEGDKPPDVDRPPLRAWKRGT